MVILMILFTFVGGIALSAQSSINGTFSRKAGTIEATLIMSITASMFLAIIILFFGQGSIFGILEAPKWQLSAVFLGTAVGLLMIAAVPKIGVIATNSLAIIGQFLIGILIDHFGWFNSLVIPLDLKRGFSLLFMILSLYFIFRGNRPSRKAAQLSP